jgi:hypothetical protein
LNKRTGAFRQRSHEEVAREIKRQVNNKAIFTLAARAAVEMLGSNGGKDIPESAYKCDEESVREYAKTVAVHIDVTGGDFQAWRVALLQRAREIVAIPYVREAIQDVALL